MFLSLSKMWQWFRMKVPWQCISLFSLRKREGHVQERELSPFFLQRLLKALCSNFPILCMDFSKGDLADTISGHLKATLPSSSQQVLALRPHSDQREMSRILLATFGRAFFFLLKGNAEDQSSQCYTSPLTWIQQPHCDQEATSLRAESQHA